MKMLRKRLTYANVTSSIALFLVIGGASAFAASHLSKNSVGSKQLKKNAVTTAKIKNNAVTTAKIQDGAISGTKINLGTLGTVPNAAHAGSADSAGHASSADSANTVGGQSVTKVFKTLLPGENNVTVASVAGFTIPASCESANVDLRLIAPIGPGSVLSAQGNGNEPYFRYSSAEANDPNSIPLDGPNQVGEASFSAALTNGIVISGQLGYDYDTFEGESPERCVVYGEITSG